MFARLLFSTMLSVAVLAGPAVARTYDIVIDRETLAVEPGKPSTVITLNGGVPGPVLRFTEGEEATIRVTNRLRETTSIHWHGLLLPGIYDGAPGFNQFRGVKPGETFDFKFNLRQSGTYWYHAHSATQEQAGQYGAFIIEPKAGPDQKVAREHVLLLSEHTREDPERVLRNLKGDSGYYNFSKRTTPEFFRDVGKFGLRKTLADRVAWGKMRMDPTDIADVGNYVLLANGRPTVTRPQFRFTPGERVRLRIINGSAMSFMDVRTPGLTMTVVAADGRAVEPVEVDEFRIGVAETYDVIVEPKDDRAYPIWIETLDRKASVLATLAPRDGMVATAPPARPRQVLLMSEMGHAMGDMAMGGKTPAMPGASVAEHDMAAMGGAGATTPAAMATNAMAGHDMTAMAAPAKDSMAGMAMPAAPAPGATVSTCLPEHAAMGHCTMPATSPPVAAAPASPAAACAPEHAAMGHCKLPAAPAPASVCAPEHAAMGHCTPAPGPTGGSRVGTAAPAAPTGPNATLFPKVDYGFGADPMAGMDHAAMGHGSGMAAMAMPALAREGDTDGSGRVLGWATGAPYGARVLSVRDLRAAVPNADTRAPTRNIVIKISGNMERYIWTLNGAKFGEAPPFRVKFNERVRVTFVNETMMAHPMHLHGMFFQVDNGQPGDRMPEKNVIAVAPGRTQSIILTANEAGEWPLHCHLLYHMESGMMQKLIVASVDNPDGTPGPAMPAMPGMDHLAHGGAR